MPTFYPTTCPQDAPTSEKKVFEAFKSLPSDWIVIHGTPVFEFAKGHHPPHEREIDFIVIHPKRGLLGLEVKGGEVGRDDTGFYSIDHFGKRHKIKDPGLQIQHAMHSLMQVMREERLISTDLQTFGWGVVLPGIDVTGGLSPGLRRELLVDRQDLAHPRSAINRLFDVHGVPESDAPKFIPKILATRIAPSFHLAPSLAGQFDDEHQELVRLTEEQVLCLEMLEAQKRVVVEGAAGTGKTLVGMEKARQSAANGARTLFLCYNSPLADHLAPRAEGFKVRTFHGFCRDMAKASGISFRLPQDSDQRQAFWDEEAPDLLSQSLDRLPDERYDAVIVDEGQDFKELWWLALEKALAKPDESVFYAFLDPRQNIYDGAPCDALGMNPFKLVHNCRNTVAIAKYAGKFVDMPGNTKPGAPEGVKVQETCFTDNHGADKAIRTGLNEWVNNRSLPTNRIALLTTDGANHGSVKVGQSYGNFKLIPAADSPSNTQVRTDSLYKFKGLEADAIMLYVAKSEHWDRAEHMYVATSRARHALHVIRPA